MTEILYDPGAAIEAGTPMFRIEDTTYQANLASAEAQVASARAQVTQSQSSFDRTQQLLGSGTTQAQVEQAQAALDQATAALQSAEADLTLAQAELGWTTVTSPLSGIASVSAASVGDLVTAGQADAMATVTQLDPIEVDMYEPSSRFLSVLDDINDGNLRLNDELAATLTLDPANPSNSTLAATIPLTDVDSNSEGLDGHLQTDDFFDTANHPTATFRATSIVVDSDDPTEADVTGELTLRGVTRPVTMEVEFNQAGPSMGGVYKVGFDGEATIRRSEFGIDFALPALGDEVELHMEGEFVLQEGDAAS